MSYYTCFEGCSCDECRQRRCDYYDMFYKLSAMGIDSTEELDQTDLEDSRLDNAMRNLGYSRNLQKKIKSYRK